jgi:D-alanyl-lipoteichoic acid acyltransferase DltB (MBOAT superfamily)
VGLVIFAIGMFKKTVIADALGPYASRLYDQGATHPLPLALAWLAAITYTFQLYFDFSGYSDMAIGLARMFGIKLPLNFHSPLRASSIMDFWRRWHMTLQRWVVSYIFQPLSLPLNRVSAERGFSGWPAFALATGFPIFLTFLVLGIWHGAGWTFVIFGTLHGLYVVINEAWNEHRKGVRRRLRRAGRIAAPTSRLELIGYHALTLAAVVLANVAFRSRTVSDAWEIWRSMFGLNLGVHTYGAAPGVGVCLVLAICAVLVFLFPNTQQIMGRFDPAYNWDEWKALGTPPIQWAWRPNVAGLLFAGFVLFAGVTFVQSGRSNFVYFNF